MSECARCGASFSCAMADQDGNADCWCTRLPPLPEDHLQKPDTPQSGARCFCPDCLRLLTEAAKD